MMKYINEGCARDHSNIVTKGIKIHVLVTFSQNLMFYAKNESWSPA
jgi:hypothetical protein